MVVVRVLVFAAGLAVVLVAIGSAIKTIVVPRAVSSSITRAVFVLLGNLIELFLRGRKEFRSRDRVLAYFAPVGLLLLPGVWVTLVIFGYSFMFWAIGSGTWSTAFTESGSSMLTLGFVPPSGPGEVVLAFTEATLGLGIVALLIAYLPSIYAAFGRREQLVGQLEVRAGTPPSASVLLARYEVIGLLHNIDTELYPKWEAWFVDVEESHTSLPVLVFFRSPQPARSWITAAGCILDTASISHSTVAGRSSAHAALMIRTGFLCLRRIADYFGLPYEVDVGQDSPISVTRREFDLLCVELVAAGIELRADRDQAWRDFVGWRANYDAVLVGIAGMISAPPGRWTSNGVARFHPRIFRRTVPH